MSDIEKLSLLLNKGYCITSIKGIYFAGCQIDLCLSNTGTSVKEFGDKTSIFTYSENLFNYAYNLFMS